MCLHTDMCIVYMWSVRLFLLAIVAVVILYLQAVPCLCWGACTLSAACITDAKILQLRCVN